MSRELRLELSSRNASLALTIVIDALYAATLALPGNWASAPVRNSVLVSLLVFVGAQVLAFTNALGRATAPGVRFNARPTHYIQLCFHMTFYLYWGLHWSRVYPHLNLIAIQLVFAMAFDSLLSWALRNEFQFGCSAWPIVGSTNLFLWFENDWFWAQLGAVALALLAKATVSWRRGGRRIHVFNPTGLSLTIAALALLALAPTDIAVGPDIPSTQDIGPHRYLVLFLITLGVNAIVPTILVTASAVIVQYMLHYLGMWHFGEPLYYFPLLAPYFLGATLLVSDPATSPDTKIGKALFGASYGLLVYCTPPLLVAANLPSGGEKVFWVPVLNLLVPWFDRIGSRAGTAAKSILGAWSRPLARHPLHMAVWIVFFLLVARDVGTPTWAWFHQVPWYTVTDSAIQGGDRANVMCVVKPRACEPFRLFDELTYYLVHR